MTVSEESRRIFVECKQYVTNGKNHVIPFIGCGTVNKRTRMYKECKRYRDDAEIDFELGVIDEKEYKIEIEAIRKFEQALANMECY